MPLKLLFLIEIKQRNERHDDQVMGERSREPSRLLLSFWRLVKLSILYRRRLEIKKKPFIIEFT